MGGHCTMSLPGRSPIHFSDASRSAKAAKRKACASNSPRLTNAEKPQRLINWLAVEAVSVGALVLIAVVVVICLTHAPRPNQSNPKLSNKTADFLQPVHQPLFSTADIEPVQTFADELILAELPPPAQVMLPEIEEPMAKPETPTK